MESSIADEFEARSMQTATSLLRDMSVNKVKATKEKRISLDYIVSPRQDLDLLQISPNSHR